jgi:chromosome partitioning protein
VDTIAPARSGVFARTRGPLSYRLSAAHLFDGLRARMLDRLPTVAGGGRGRVTRVIAIANQKGGVGKTTTAVSLAAGLAEAGARTLAVDLDPQGHLTINMGVRRPDELEVTVYNILAEPETAAAQARLRSEPIGVDFLPANIELSGAELQLVTEMGREQVLQDKLTPLLPEYDFAVIDCPPSLGLLCVNALVVASEVIIPLQCEYFGMKGMQQLQRTIERVRAKLNPRLSIDGILPTMFKPRTLHSQEVLDLVRERYGSQVYDLRVDSSIRFAESPLAGLSILQYASDSAGARAYRELTRLVMAAPAQTTGAGQGEGAGRAIQAGTP